MTESTRSQRKLEREKEQQQMLKRYQKQRQRNAVAIPGDMPFAIVLDNLKAGFNVPKIFRSAHAFGASEVHLVNIGPFDPSAAKGAFRKVPARFHETFQQAHHELREKGYQLYALTPTAEAQLPTTALDKKAAFIMGHEEHGLSIDLADYPDIKHLSIPHVGLMESLNVSVAASIVMYEYCRQHTDLEVPQSDE